MLPAGPANVFPSAGDELALKPGGLVIAAIAFLLTRTLLVSIVFPGMDESMAALLIRLLPIIIGLAIVVFGVSLAVSTHDKRYVRTVTTWYLIGSLGLLVLVGLGTVGRHLLSLLDPFDATVSVYDPYVSPADVAEHDAVTKATLEEALDSDVVSIHAARTPETIDMIGAEELATLPDGALLINTARAEIVQEEPLLEELESGRIRAALDVFHEEPLPADSPLRDLGNVQLTPHVGGGRLRTPFTEAIIDEIERHLDGRALQHEIPRGQYERMTR